MVNTADFCKHTEIFAAFDTRLFDEERFTSLLDEVIKKLPDEDWFNHLKWLKVIKGKIIFTTRQNGIEYWQQIFEETPKKWRSKPDFSPGTHGFSKIRWQMEGEDASNLKEALEHIRGEYITTIIVDDLHSFTDDCIKGLMIHELCEMTNPFRKLHANWAVLKKMHRRKNRKFSKAQFAMMNEWTDAPVDFESKEYREHEIRINNECIRLGFQKEIDAMKEELDRFKPS